MKLCKDCKHYRKGGLLDWCTRLDAGYISPITGEIEPRSDYWLRCEKERDALLFGCKRSGKYWEAK